MDGIRPDFTSFVADLSAAGLAQESATNTHNVTGVAASASCLVRPERVSQISQLVALARKHHVALYPFSTGFNWGYGSRAPVKDGAVLVDLGRMRAIRNASAIGIDNPVAVIEPGVTQGDLADFLAQHHPGLMFNVTGSARETSVIGASLDRAVGYFGPRRDDLFGLEVVTGRGDLLHTGFRRLGEESAIAHCHPYGLGPQLDGLFFQGNYGIVTSACLRLMPRRACHVAISIGIRKEADLPEVINRLGRLKRGGVLPAVTHVGNRARTHATLSESLVRFYTDQCAMSEAAARNEMGRALDAVSPHPWTGLAGVYGTRAQVRAAIREIRSVVGSYGDIQVVTDSLLAFAIKAGRILRHVPMLRSRIAAANAIKPLHGLATGKPSSVAVENLVMKYSRMRTASVEELDRSACGLLFISPVLPLDGKRAVAVLKRLEAIAAGFGHTLYITLNIEMDLTQVAVINVLFDRTVASEVEQAHHCAKALYERIHAEGLSVYRARIDMMESITHDIRGSSGTYWTVAKDLKKVLDPDDIIAPGRYNLELTTSRTA